MNIDVSKLAAEFPRDAVSWRAQTLTKNGDKALALAYIDARDVMNRLDEVCGPTNWQTEIAETAKGRVICRLGIFINDQWVWKSDGAGATDVEGEKGGISDAIKRAAVLWGVGRYLYSLKAPWVPCATYDRDGKAVWSKWTADPWDFVQNVQTAQNVQKADPPEELRDRLKAAISKQTTRQLLAKFWDQRKTTEAFAKLPAPMQGELTKAYTDKLVSLPDDPALQAPQER